MTFISGLSKRNKRRRTLYEAVLTGAFGLAEVAKTERSVRLIFLSGFIFIVLGFLSRVSDVAILIMIFAWLEAAVSEIFNTSLEKAADFASDREFHPLIKKSKDFAAASVFLLSLFAWGLSLFILFKAWF